MQKERPNKKPPSLLNEVFNTAANGMCLIDKKFNVVAINTTLAEMFKLDKEDIIGKKCYDVLHGSACNTERCCLIRILRGEKRVEFETEKIHGDSSKSLCIISANPFFGSNGKLVGIVEDLKDISRLKEAEAKLEQLKQASGDANLEEQKILLQHMHDLRIALHELNKIEKYRLSDDVDSQKMTRVTIIEPAQVPLKPVSPKVFLNLMLGLCLGALGGLGVAVCLHFLDDSLESVEDVENTLDVPVLISIPYDKKERA